MTPSACQAASADANCDGTVTPADAQAIFNDFLGALVLPTCCAGSPAPAPVPGRAPSVRKADNPKAGGPDALTRRRVVK